MKKEELEYNKIYIQKITPGILKHFLTGYITNKKRFSDIISIMSEFQTVAGTEFACDITGLFKPGEAPLEKIGVYVNQGSKMGVFHNTSYRLCDDIHVNIFAIHTHPYSLCSSGIDLQCAGVHAFILSKKELQIYNPDLRWVILPYRKNILLFLMQENIRHSNKKELVEFGIKLFEETHHKNKIVHAYAYAEALEKSGFFNTHITYCNKKGRMPKKDIGLIAEKFAYSIKIRRVLQKKEKRKDKKDKEQKKPA